MSVSASANSASASKQETLDMTTLNNLNFDQNMQTGLDLQFTMPQQPDQGRPVRPKLRITTSTPRGEALASTPTFVRFTGGCSPRMHRAGADLPLELRQYATHFRDQVWIGPDAPQLDLLKFTIEPDLDPRTGKSPQKRERSDSVDSIQLTPVECYPSSRSDKIWWVRFGKDLGESNPHKVVRRPTKYVHAESHEQADADTGSDDAAESDQSSDNAAGSDRSSLKTTASGGTCSTGKRSSGSSDSGFKGSVASPARVGYEDPVLHPELLADQPLESELLMTESQIFGSSSKPDLRLQPPSPLRQPGSACHCAQGFLGKGCDCKSQDHDVTETSPGTRDGGKTKGVHWYSRMLGPLKVINP